jgi:hypothetical protein
MGSSGIDELRCAVLDRCRSSIELGYPCLGGVLVALPITEAERELLEQRLKEDDDDPDAAIPWEIARADLLQPR